MSKPKKLPIEKITKPKQKKTKEQQAGVPNVVNQSFEGVRKIDHLPFQDQMNQIFNPLQAITKTDVKDAPSEASYVVEKKPEPQG